MHDHVLFLLYWLVNSILIYLFGLTFPSSVVLGSYRLIPFEASIYSGFWLTFFVWTMWDYMLFRKVVLEPDLLRSLFFFFVNSLGIWLISRYGEYTGLGITSLWWAFLIGGGAYLLQRISWKALKKYLPNL